MSSQLTWRCEAVAVPRATYTWYKNTLPLTSLPGDVDIYRNTLVIKQAHPERHNGMYQCLARNRYGETFSSAQLKVLSEWSLWVLLLLFVCLFVCLLVCLFLLFSCLRVCLFLGWLGIVVFCGGRVCLGRFHIYLFICVFIYLFIYLFICLFVCLFIYLFVCLFVCLFIYLFIVIIVDVAIVVVAAAAVVSLLLFLV